MWWRATSILTVLAGAACALPPAASAAWTEAAAYAVPGGGPAACLRPTGAGRLALAGPITDGRSTVAVLSAGADGLTPLTQTPLGSLSACAAAGASAAPGADVLLAGITTGTPSLRGAVVFDGVRYPSQGAADAASSLVTASAGGPSAVLAHPVRSDGSPQLAVAAGGAAVVAWLGNPPGGRPAVPGVDVYDEPSTTRLLVAVSPGPGLPFGAPVRINDRLSPLADDGSFSVGIDDAATVTVSWVGDPPRADPGTPYGRRFVSTLPLGGAPTRQALGTGFDPAALVVASNGRALIALDGAVGERVGRTGPFAPVDLGDIPRPATWALALRSDGAAVVAGLDDPGAWAVTRPPGGTFGPVQVIVPQPGGDDGAFVSSVLEISSSGRATPARDPEDSEAGALRAAVGDDGEVVITWVDAHQGAPDAASVMAVHGTLTGGLEPVATLSNPCRIARDSRPVRLADGRLAIGWTDNAAGTLDIGAARDGRVHVAVPASTASGAPATSGPAPTVRVSVAGSTRLRAYQPLRVRLTCDGAPCDALAVTRTSQRRYAHMPVDDPGWNGGSTSQPTGGSGIVGVIPFGPSKQRGARRARHPVEVLACTPEGAVVQRVRFAPVLTRRAPEPAPVVRGARATQRGSTIRVSWHTTRPVRSGGFALFAATRASRTLTTASVLGHGRSRFTATLRLPSRRRVATVTLSASSNDSGAGHEVKVPVRHR